MTDVPTFNYNAATNELLAAIIESSDDAIISKNLNGIVTSWNSGAQRIFGYTPEEMIGQSITKLIPPDRLSEEPHILSKLRKGERIDHYETIRVTKDGRQIDVSVTVSPIKDPSGVIVGASKIARDISASRELTRQLNLAKEQAEASSRAKDQFLSVLSHELRTPLTPVLFSLSNLEARPELPRELREELAMARRNIETEARLVDDLLDLTRISRSKLKLRLEIVDVHQVIRTSLQMMQNALDDKSIDISISLRAKQHHTWADPGRLQQIFLNVFSNAVKFTPAGGAIAVRALNPQPDRMTVDITDTGIGIEPEMLQRLFDPFEQGDIARTRQFGGLGLGLSISRALAELHGGILSAKSPGAGKGATFTLELNAMAAVVQEPRTEIPGETQLGHPMRVLLVEDHADTRTVVSRLLRRLGCTVTVAGSVKEALSLVEFQSFDLLISDIGLPDGTGLEVMRYARGHGQIKGIALSGFGMEEDVRRSEEAGFTVHLTKPINFQMLEDTIHKLAAVA